jgi:CDP-diacylglycerol--glycerol-3-phosphate 3-phosphatidyltransferase/cardiolipin synthase
VRRIPAWLPDALTLSRLALLPAFLIAAEAARAGAGRGEAPARGVALALMIAIAASDKLDGYFARRSARGPTRRGAILDAVSDRTVQWIGVLFLTFRAEPGFTPLPVWLPICLAAREVLLVATWLRTRGGRAPPVEHEMHGRIATVAMFGTLIAATAALPGAVVTTLAALAGGNVLYSALRYAGRIRRHVA